MLKKNFKSFLKKSVLFNMKLRHFLKVRYLAAGILCLGGIVVAYMVGCSDTMYVSTHTVDCNSFASMTGGSCQTVDFIPEGEGEPPPGGSSPGSTPPGSGTSPGSGTPPGSTPEGGTPPGSGIPPGPRYYQFEDETTLGKVDILFVIDNSSSMHKEHKKLGKQIERFLKNIKDLSYRIVVITTDISSSPDNPVQGAEYQDGNFIPLANSRQQFLENSRVGESPSDEDIEDLVKTIVRPETIACEGGTDEEDEGGDIDFRTGKPRTSGSGGGVTCPSYDERGIYALNLAIEKQTSFFDSDAHLMIVILSDEDERSSEEFMKQNNLVLETKDLPETLVDTVANYLGPMQTFSVHSIIIPPGDDGCLTLQNQGAYEGPGSGRGWPGEQYARLSKANEPELTKTGQLIRGSILSICDKKFDQHLARVNIFAQVPRVAIPCGNPARVVFRANGERVRLDYTVNGRALEFESGYLPLGSTLFVRAYCPAN